MLQIVSVLIRAIAISKESINFQCTPARECPLTYKIHGTIPNVDDDTSQSRPGQAWIGRVDRRYAAVPLFPRIASFSMLLPRVRPHDSPTDGHNGEVCAMREWEHSIRRRECRLGWEMMQEQVWPGHDMLTRLIMPARRDRMAAR